MVFLQWMTISLYQAFSLTFSKKRVISTFPILLGCGLIFLFFHALALHAQAKWLSVCAAFFSYFCSFLLLFPLGVFLCNSYAAEVKKKNFSAKKFFFHAWDRLIASSLLALPFIGAFLLLWLALVIFLFFKHFSFLQEIVSSLFVFLPFFLILVTLGLSILSGWFLFYMTPQWMVFSLDRNQRIGKLLFQLKGHLGQELGLAGLASLPFWILFWIFQKTAELTHHFIEIPLSFFSSLLQGLIFIAIASFFLSFGLIFFFHMAVEAFWKRSRSS